MPAERIHLDWKRNATYHHPFNRAARMSMIQPMIKETNLPPGRRNSQGAIRFPGLGTFAEYLKFSVLQQKNAADSIKLTNFPRNISL